MEAVPGTQHLVEHNFKSGIARQKGNTEIVLQPKPSSSPDDPLNWSRPRKSLATACTTVFTFFNGFAASNLYSVLQPLSEKRGLSLSTLNAGTGYLFLLAGLGLLVWQPLALQYGKRPIYLVSLLGMLTMNIWGPFISSRGQWYARSIVIGFFASPVEALPEATVADLYFVHERGSYMSIYAAALVGSNFFAPIICGFINDGQGYQWVFYWSAIFCGAALVFLFLAMEETNFDRPEQLVENYRSPSREEKLPYEAVMLGNWSSSGYFRRLKLIQTRRPFAVYRHLRRQLLFLLWPIPLYAGFAYGSCLIWFNVLNATSSSTLSAAPYNFSSSIVGLSYIAGVIGVAVGFLVTGPLSDHLIVYLSKRHKGSFEPEYRLWLFVFPTLFVPTGLLLWGLGSAAEIHWVGLLFALGFLAFQNACGASIAVTYLVDSYREMSGDALTALIIVRNLMSFAVSYGINPWIEGMGTREAFGLAAGIGFVASLAWVIMVVFGKSLRQGSAKRYWKLVREQGHEIRH